MTRSHRHQAIYALLTVAGLVWTQYYLVEFLKLQSGEVSVSAFLQFDWSLFLSHAFANPAAAFLSVDTIIGATAFIFWMLPEARKLGMRNRWLYVALTLGVAFAVGFPAFLFMRERKLQELKAA